MPLAGFDRGRAKAALPLAQARFADWAMAARLG